MDQYEYKITIRENSDGITCVWWIQHDYATIADGEAVSKRDACIDVANWLLKEADNPGMIEERKR